MKADTDINISSMAGLGPAAWGGDTQKVSMHPPIPGHIEFVAEEMKSHTQHHHIVQRRHPENDNEVTLIRKEITLEDMGYHPHRRHHCHREKARGATANGDSDKVHSRKHHRLHHRYQDNEKPRMFRQRNAA